MTMYHRVALLIKKGRVCFLKQVHASIPMQIRSFLHANICMSVCVNTCFAYLYVCDMWLNACACARTSIAGYLKEHYTTLKSTNIKLNHL